MKTFNDEIKNSGGVEELNDDALDGVAGGWIIFSGDESDPSNQEYKPGSNRKGQC